MAENPAGFDLELRKRHLYQAKRSLPGPHYYVVLSWIHQALRPLTYVEIGIQNGDSLLAALPETVSAGIDPCPTPNKPLPPNTRILPMTSDEFFDRHHLPDVLGHPHFSLAFIDGLHVFEQALLDFIHLERYAARDSVIVLHDCLPLDRVTSSRTRTTDFYSGDVWKLVLCLSEMRPELRMAIVPTNPTGLCIVGGLDPQSTRLPETYEACVGRYVGLDFDDYRMRALQMPTTIANTRSAVEGYLEGLRAEIGSRIVTIPSALPGGLRLADPGATDAASRAHPLPEWRQDGGPLVEEG